MKTKTSASEQAPRHLAARPVAATQALRIGPLPRPLAGPRQCSAGGGEHADPGAQLPGPHGARCEACFRNIGHSRKEPSEANAVPIRIQESGWTDVPGPTGGLPRGQTSPHYRRERSLWLRTKKTTAALCSHLPMKHGDTKLQDTCLLPLHSERKSEPRRGTLQPRRTPTEGTRVLPPKVPGTVPKGGNEQSQQLACRHLAHHHDCRAVFGKPSRLPRWHHL